MYIYIKYFNFTLNIFEIIFIRSNIENVLADTINYCFYKTLPVTLSVVLDMYIL